MPESPAARSMIVTAGLVVVGFLLVLAGAATFGPVDDASVALAVCGAALVYALRRLFLLVRTLSRPDAFAQVGRGAGQFTQAELRDEKRRLLRAIKELEFDFGMGKLSQGDYDAVIGTYRLRAIEVMRALEGGAELHPELQRLLAERDRPATEEPPPSEIVTQQIVPSAAPANFDQTARICASCNGNNENDARFCKHCGAALPRKGSAPPAQTAPKAAAGEIA